MNTRNLYILLVVLMFPLAVSAQPRNMDMMAKGVRNFSNIEKNLFNEVHALAASKELSRAKNPLSVLRNDWKSISITLGRQLDLTQLSQGVNEGEIKLADSVLKLPEVQLEKCQKDLLSRVERLNAAQMRNGLFSTEKSRLDFIHLVDDIVGFGLYGDLKDVDKLYAMYLSVENTTLGKLILVPVVRSIVVMGDPEKAKQMVLNAQNSPARKQLWEFLNRQPVSIGREVFVPDASLEKLELKGLSSEQMIVFDFSPVATARWIEISSNIRNSINSAKRFSYNRTRLTTVPRRTAKTPLPASPRALKQQPIAADLNMRSEVTPVSPAPKLAGPVKPQTTAAAVPSQQHHVVQKPQRKKGVYPSGLSNESQLIFRWAGDYQKGYFLPRNQIEAIEGMSAQKANNVVEYLYYMDLAEAEKVILQPIFENGRLPEFMYDNKLIPNTKRLPSMYYKNKFNDNVKRIVALADGEGTLFRDTAELTDLLISMKDYTFEQGFAFTNSEELSTALRKKWQVIVEEVTKENAAANRALINQLWREPVVLADGTKVSLRDYFTQTRPTAFFPNGAMPEFYLNSPKWVSWENVRRDLISKEILPPQPDSFVNNVIKKMAGIDDKKYMTLEQFGQLMTDPYLRVYRDLREFDVREGAVSTSQSSEVAEDHIACLDEQIRQNNFDVVGGVCMSSFGDGGFLGNRDPNYDGTSLRSRYEPVVFDNVKVAVFNDETLKPEIRVYKVSYLKDLKKVDPYKEKASRMVGDGLDETRDLLSVQQASAAVLKIPSLRATIRPHNRISYADKVPYMFGGGLAGYFALFTPDFYPIKEVKLLREVNGKKQWVTEYFIRREVVALSGFIHRERLTFSSQANLREQVGPTLSGKSDIQFNPKK